ncbi:creatininase family protein [Murimonas intestini]|uniref:Creatinine amidohydrolase n=1 Tax=Murimonas intestini TaxID=1337051 RepID=A0AB73T469_9FIRM|nr:creatininase family protein [Murimonas intestini]MCR1841005.1 creatininase family protein [Murimonas intestini]MCR1865877.1 creatininase family protein [Murimonas intestini]MCR1883297.1 creatininase family protein [Murimonas intestini]
MYWEELTADDFAEAVKSTGVCVIPMGVVEKHGSHLPLGTDMIIGRTIAEMAARLEPFVIFPYYYFGQINEARHVPGTIAVSPELQMKLLQEAVDEIRRNGFRKIVLLESHGGNINFLDYFLQAQLYEKRDYTLYKIGVFDIIEECCRDFAPSDDDGHAARTETELVMAYHPELVHMDRVNAAGAENLHRLDHLRGASTPVSWYCDHPTHQDGSPSGACPEIGIKKYEIAAAYVADVVKRIKADETAPEIMKEYYDGWGSWL